VSSEPLIAVFIDYENLALGVRDVDPKKKEVEIGLVLKRLLEKGRIVYKCAYCDWSHYRGATRELHEHGVSMVDIPQTGVGGKNSADIHMVVDAMDLCYARPHISLFALLSGDSDFSPLVYKLKELDKRVIGCGVKSSTSRLLVESCDEFIYYDDLVARAARPRKEPARAPAAGKTDPRREEGVDQVLDVVRSLAQDYENVWGSMVKQTLSRINPGFNHEYHGYGSWAALLADLEKRGLVELDSDKTRGNVLIRLREQAES
jgi:hypothetical protein